jgi:nucleotide-binding universal stress UspA family protein
VFQNILVPLDGSPRAETALPLALSIARASGAQLRAVLVHVPHSYSDYEYPGAEDLERDAKSRERAYLDTLAARLGAMPKGSVSLAHLEGIPEETLIEEVAERDIDLVVMNVHGWGYLSRAMTGSVSDYLMRHLSVPMLVMHAAQLTGEITQEVALRRILISLDGSHLAETVIRPAVELGTLWTARYNLVRVIAPLGPMASPDDEESRALEQHFVGKAKLDAAGYLNGVAGRIGDGASIEISLPVHPNPTIAILHEAKSKLCDAIAISTHGRGGLGRLLFGSVADKVMRGADCPVLVYRPPH